jgi:hypothetical protein
MVATRVKIVDWMGGRQSDFHALFKVQERVGEVGGGTKNQDYKSVCRPLSPRTLILASVLEK